MKNLNILFILTVLLIVTISSVAYMNKRYSDIEVINSTVDGLPYLVRKMNRDCPHTSAEAANILATLKNKTISFINNLQRVDKQGDKQMDREGLDIQNNYKKNDKNKNNKLNFVIDSSIGGDNPRLIKQLRDDEEEERLNRLFVERLSANFRPNSISEKSGFQSGTSYSLNKGEKIVMCIRQADNSFVDLNTLTYVLLHELTHLGTIEEKTHSQVFDRNFRYALDEAVTQGLYQYEPYHQKPVPYCGRMISDTHLRN